MKPCPDPSWGTERSITWGGPSITGYHTNHTTEKGYQPHVRKAEEHKTESLSVPRTSQEDLRLETSPMPSRHRGAGTW